MKTPLLEVAIETLQITVTPTLDYPLIVVHSPERREVVIRTPFPEPLIVDFPHERLSLHYEHVELRLSEEAVRQLFEKLPPELLH
jgi:hypothetical protein